MTPRIARLSFRILITALAVIAGAVGASAQAQAQDAPAAPLPQAPVPKPPVKLAHVDFPSLDGKTMLITHLLRPKDSGDEPRPAVVMLHGCSGLLAKSGHFFGIYRAWAKALLDKGYVVLVVDSATSRGFGATCGPGEARRIMWRDRPKDAYAALLYLQAQPFVRGNRIALMGWSQGGGVVLLSINDKSIGRPADLKTDFTAAVAFYPGVCDEKWQSKPFTQVEPHGWTAHMPLLVLMGEADVWTRLKPCAEFLDAAKARGNAIDLKTYPGAVHGFDAPNTPRHELPQYTERDGRIPIIGTDSEARADAFARVGAFLEEKLR